MGGVWNNKKLIFHMRVNIGVRRYIIARDHSIEISGSVGARVVGNRLELRVGEACEMQR